MIDLLLTLFVGWPAIVATIIIAAIGLWRRDYRLIFGASVLAFPFSWNVSGFPVVHAAWFLLPLLLLASSYLMFRDHEMLAWLVAIPFFLFALLLFYATRA